jgi:hypothetical protein
MAQQGVLTNITGAVFHKGYAYGTRSGGMTDAIAFAALQNISLNDSLTKVLMRGPESLAPLGVGIGEETLTGTFEWGVITPEQYFSAIGGNLSYDSVNTTYTKLVNEEPKPFNLKVQTDITNPEITVTLFNCIVDTWKVLDAKQREWIMGGGTFTVYGEANGGRLFTMSRPGDYTNAS